MKINGRRVDAIIDWQLSTTEKMTGSIDRTWTWQKDDALHSYDLQFVPMVWTELSLP